jgi:acetyl-CoA/propionyl-CoA carboxylase biotin carboxyl carrier protein
LQVEHPVTEETAGVDLVIEQFRIAEGEALSFKETPTPRGHSFEFRINIEDPARGFLPSSGKITDFNAPSGPGIRLDSGVESGSSLSPMFDSLAAKLIVTGATREQAIARARRALREFTLEGVPSVLPFHRAVMDHVDFTGESFNVHTRWIETDFAEELSAACRPEEASSQDVLRGRIEIDGKQVSIALPAAFLSLLNVSGVAAPIKVAENVADEGAVEAPVSGTLVQWSVEGGSDVEAGSVIGMMEAMKMETPITAPISGTIEFIAKSGEFQNAGTAIARINSKGEAV